MNSSHLKLSSTTWFVRTSLLIVEIQVEWSLWQYVGRVSKNLEENVIEDLENRSLKFPIAGDFLTGLKQEFGNRDNKLVKIVELKESKVGRKNNRRICTRV